MEIKQVMWEKFRVVNKNFLEQSGRRECLGIYQIHEKVLIEFRYLVYNVKYVSSYPWLSLNKKRVSRYMSSFVTTVLIIFGVEIE